MTITRRTGLKGLAAAAGTLALPMYPGLTADEQQTVIDAVRAAVERHGARAGLPAETAAAAPVGTRSAAGAREAEIVSR